MVMGRHIQRGSSLGELCFDGIHSGLAIGQVQLRLDGRLDGAESVFQPFVSADGTLACFYQGDVYDRQRLLSELPRTPSGGEPSGAELVFRYLERHYQGDLKRAVCGLVDALDGVFALAVTDHKQTVIARDHIGIRQLYFSNRGHSVAFASEKKSLYELSGIDTDVHRLPPGHIATINGNGLDVSCFWELDTLLSAERISDPSIALEAYSGAIRKAVQKRLSGKDRVGIVFSGGIDSLIIAHLVKQSGVAFNCYTAGCEGAEDLLWAESIARDSGFPIRLKTLSVSEIEQCLPEIISTIEDHSHNQVEAATAMFFANRLAQEAGEHTIFTGQAADEIFGGYPWYPAVVDREGYPQFERYAWQDFAVGFKETFERENKIAAAHGLNMSVPYADLEVDKIAFEIAPHLKIASGSDDIQKRIHREFALSLGIPRHVAFRKKAAAQHGANVHNACEQLAAKTGITESMLVHAGYNPDITVSEKLGSSSRYGYRYGDEALWKPSLHVQYYLDSLAGTIGMLTSQGRAHIRAVSRELGANVPF